MKALIKGVEGFKGKLVPPPDKSISHRAAVFSAIAEGESRIENFLIAQDCLSTVEALKNLGVEIFLDIKKAKLEVKGKGIDGLNEPVDIIDAGNSASTMRILTGLVSSYSFLTVITGDASLRKRPMDRVIVPLNMMGATILARNQRFAPLCIKGKRLKGINYSLPIASAQLKTALILAALRAEGETVIEEPGFSRDHSERILKLQGASIKVFERVIRVKPAIKLNPLHFSVPGDFSSAAFFIVASLICPDSEIEVEGVNLNTTRTGLLEVLTKMNARFQIEITRRKTEPVGNIKVFSSNLKSTNIGEEIMPRLIDEGPILFVAMALANGTSTVSGASELRIKESDRIKAMSTELKKMGARIKEKKDGLIIEGVKKLKGVEVNSYGDHRIAMALSIAALAAEGETVINDAECVDVSFPNFFQFLKTICNARVMLTR